MLATNATTSVTILTTYLGSSFFIPDTIAVRILCDCSTKCSGSWQKNRKCPLVIQKDSTNRNIPQPLFAIAKKLQSKHFKILRNKNQTLCRVFFRFLSSQSFVKSRGLWDLDWWSNESSLQNLAEKLAEKLASFRIPEIKNLLQGVLKVSL